MKNNSKCYLTWRIYLWKERGFVLLTKMWLANWLPRTRSFKQSNELIKRSLQYNCNFQLNVFAQLMFQDVWLLHWAPNWCSEGEVLTMNLTWATCASYYLQWAKLNQKAMRQVTQKEISWGMSRTSICSTEANKKKKSPS